jgi:hypothetical protein
MQQSKGWPLFKHLSHQERFGHRYNWVSFFVGNNALFLFSNTQTVHIKSIIHNSIAVLPKTLYAGGMRTRVL